MTDITEETEAQTEEFPCVECGQACKSAAGLAAHSRSHSGGTPEVSPPPASGGPAIIPEWRSTPKVRVGIRSITMLDPRCRICQNADNVSPTWYKSCPHDPYVTVATIPEKEPIREAEVVDGKETGRMVITGMRDIERYVAIPNTRGISLSQGSNSGNGVEWARRKGFILPSELRSPTYPNGIKDTCQFHDCKQQQNLIQYGGWGVYCREEEVQLVWHYETGKTLEVGEWNQEARQARADQLKTAQIGVGVPA